jgi:hypothetical protein
VTASFVPRVIALVLSFVVPVVCARRDSTPNKLVSLLAVALFAFHALSLGPLARGEGVLLYVVVLAVAGSVVAILRATRDAPPTQSRLQPLGLAVAVVLVFMGARSLGAVSALARDPEQRFRIDVMLSGGSPASMRRLAFARLEAGAPSSGIDLALRAAELDPEELTHLASFAEASALAGECGVTERALAMLARDASRIEPFARDVVRGYVREARSLCPHAL